MINKALMSRSVLKNEKPELRGRFQVCCCIIVSGVLQDLARTPFENALNAQRGLLPSKGELLGSGVDHLTRFTNTVALFNTVYCR